MAYSTEPLIPPSPGDYQRMGLRAPEFRPLVIRRALERSAQPLASMHLQSPDADVERLLLGVLVSAYRVLDPRRRADSQSRIMLGRIHPQLADEAVQVAQARFVVPQGGLLGDPVPPPMLDQPKFEQPGGGPMKSEPTALVVSESVGAERSAEANPSGSAGNAVSSDQSAGAGPEVSVSGAPSGMLPPSLAGGMWPARADADRLSGTAPPLEVQLRTTERFLDAATVPGWEKTLHASDLLVRPASKQAYRAVRRQLAGASAASTVAVTLLAATVLMVGTWRATLWLRSFGQQRQVVSVSEPVPADVPQREALEAPAATAAILPAMSDLAALEIPAGTPTAERRRRAESPAVERPPQIPLDPSAETAEEPARAPLRSTDAAPAPTVAALGSKSVARESTGAGGEPAEGPEDSAIVVTRPRAGDDRSETPSPREQDGGDSQDASALGVSQGGLRGWENEPEAFGTGEDAEAEVAALPAVPPESQQAAARLHVEALVRSQRSDRGNDDQLMTVGTTSLGVGVPGDGGGAERQIELLRSVASEAAAGSAERWVAMMLAGQAAMLGGRGEDSQRAISELTQSFEIGVDEATLKLARWAAGDVVSEPQRRSVATWIERRVQAYVLDGELAVASQLVGIAHDLGIKQRDDAIKAQSRLWRDSLAIARRYAEAAERLGDLGDGGEPTDDQGGQASAEDRGLAGRYWALVRRDWHRALPHLAAGTHAKLAHFAGIELLSGAALDAQDATLLAEGYVGEAKRAKGWLADSYVLHAHALLLATAKTASETQSLELTRAAGKLKADHAEAFRQSTGSRPTQLAQNAEASDSPPVRSLPGGLPAADVGVETGEAFMLGRVAIAGQDIGVLVRYEPGMPLSAQVVDQIAMQLRIAAPMSPLDSGSIEMEFVGMIRLDQPTTVSVSLLPLSDGAAQSVAINGQVLSADSAVTTRTSQRYDVDLLGGEYLLRWTATMAAEDRLAIRVTDRGRGEALRVFAPPSTMPGHPERLPTRLRVSLVRGE